jgi:hypothetical protein
MIAVAAKMIHKGAEPKKLVWFIIVVTLIDINIPGQY